MTQTHIMSTDMPMHKAIATTKLRTIDEILLPTPKPGQGKVLIEVKYAAISPLDQYQVDYGYVLKESDYPQVLGLTAAGFVKSVGEGVEDLKEGDRVRLFLVHIRI